MNLMTEYADTRVKAQESTDTAADFYVSRLEMIAEQCRATLKDFLAA